jgi:hypothetical protein
MHRLYFLFRKEIKEMQNDNTQVLRAKVVATESCKFVIAYAEEMLARLVPRGEEIGEKAWQGLDNSKLVIN